MGLCITISSVQSLSRVRLFATPWTAACQASLSITNSQSLPKLMSIKLVMPSNHLILCRPLLLLPSIFPSIRVFSSESVLHISGQSIGVPASASVLPMNIHDWFPLGWTGWISLHSKGLSKVFSNTTVHNRSEFIHWILTQDLSLPVHPLISTCAYFKPYLGCSLWLFTHIYKSASAHLYVFSLIDSWGSYTVILVLLYYLEYMPSDGLLENVIIIYEIKQNYQHTLFVLF